MRRVTWLGHASVLIEAGAARLLTDPVLRRRVAHLVRHAEAGPQPGRLDAVLVSHAHYDHLDRPTLRRLADPATAAVVPRGVAPLVTGLGYGTVHELEPGASMPVADTSVRAVPAWHDGRRRPGTAALGVLGYVVDGVWFAGDTELNDAMADLRGSVDVALVPIWGWGPSLGPGHLDPEAAARAVALVAPRVAIPVHWGTYLPLGLGHRHADLLVTPPREFAEHVARLAPATRVEVLAVGASLAL